MLIDDLYTIEQVDLQQDNACVRIRLNACHTIYQGHFPGMPITPGVCLLQIAQELLSYIDRREYSIVACKNIKYLGIIDPIVHPVVEYQLQWSTEEDCVKLKVTVIDGHQVFSKMSIVLK